MPCNGWVSGSASLQQLQFFEQYSHEPYIAVARFIARFLGLPEDRRVEYDSKYAYTHLAHEGGFDLSQYASVRKWLKKIADHPNYVGMVY